MNTIVKEIPSNTFWWITNLVSSIAFIPLHLFIVGVMFFAYLKVNIGMYLWSGIQLSLALYSFLILLGPVPVQIVMLYARLPVRILSFLYLTTSIVALVFTALITILSLFHIIDDDFMSNLYSLVYQVLIFAPTIVLIVPMLFYLNELDQYMAKEYPSLYSNNNMFFAPKPNKAVVNYLKDLVV